MKFIICLCILALCSSLKADTCVSDFQDLGFVFQKRSPLSDSDVPDSSPPTGAQLIGVLISDSRAKCGKCKAGAQDKCRGPNGNKTTDACAALDGLFQRENLIKKATPNKPTFIPDYSYKYYVYLKNGEKANCTY